MKPRLAIAALLVALAPASASADPTVWGRAADPKAAQAADALAEYRALYTSYLELSIKPDSTVSPTGYLHRARHLLEAGGAMTSSDPALRAALARVESSLHGHDHDIHHVERALELLSWVVRWRRGAHQASEARSIGLSTEFHSSVLGELALCYAHLERRRDEIAGYNDALAIEVRPFQRSVLLANQAEGLMAEGDLVGSIRGYREALALLPNIVVALRGATTVWGLAVALDRSGDHPAALEQVNLARSYDPKDEQFNENWFFMPPYDEQWYAALGHEAHAAAATDPESRIAALEKAIDSWRGYIAAAPSTDRWLGLAEQRLHRAERARASARARQQQ